MVLHKFVNFRL